MQNNVCFLGKGGLGSGAVNWNLGELGKKILSQHCTARIMRTSVRTAFSLLLKVLNAVTAPWLLGRAVLRKQYDQPLQRSLQIVGR